MNRHRGREGSNWVLYQRGSEGVEGMSDQAATFGLGIRHVGGIKE